MLCSLCWEFSVFESCYIYCVLLSLTVKRRYRFLARLYFLKEKEKEIEREREREEEWIIYVYTWIKINNKTRKQNLSHFYGTVLFFLSFFCSCLLFFTLHFVFHSGSVSSFWMSVNARACLYVCAKPKREREREKNTKQIMMSAYFSMNSYIQYRMRLNVYQFQTTVCTRQSSSEKQRRKKIRHVESRWIYEYMPYVQFAFNRRTNDARLRIFHWTFSPIVYP